METTTLEPRIANPAFAVPGAMDALTAMNKAISRVRSSQRTLELMHLRASQINGCGVCAVQHPKIARKLGETDDRIFAVAAWRDAPFFTDAERAALALTEIGPDAREAAPALIEALKDAEWSVRRQAALALGRIGPEARSALPALEKLGRDPDHLVRKAAREALKNIRHGSPTP